MGTITVKHLGKAYKHYPGHWARLAEWLDPRGRPRHQLHWVLQDIHFTVNPGEAVGIIGINGAGKSTLLKIITGTTRPSTGSVHTTGRIAALLELGMGFHPDFTGRQNAYMAGQLLGYSVAEMTQLMPGIEAFAELGDYIDQPVRIYSSGMQMRLAFSVATARRPDVLIVDEALSVGDAYFQHKSFDRIRAYRQQGTTLLFVSHDKQAIQTLCDRAILINGGKLAMQGPPEAVMDYYNALLAERPGQHIQQQLTPQGKLQTISGNGHATIAQVRLLNTAGQALETLTVGQDVTLQISVKVHHAIPELVLGFMIKDQLGHPIFGTNTHHLQNTLHQVQPGSHWEFNFHWQANIGPGDYSIAVALHAGHDHIAANYEWRDLALIFKVLNTQHPSFLGAAWLPLQTTIRQQGQGGATTP